MRKALDGKEGEHEKGIPKMFPPRIQDQAHKEVRMVGPAHWQRADCLNPEEVAS